MDILSFADIKSKKRTGRGRDNLNEQGMMTVEAILCLVPFMIVIFGIISFINIFAVHNKIQYALYQMGNELSCYTYFYEALGIRAADLGLKKDIDIQTEQLDGTIEELSAFMGQISEFEDSLTSAANGNSDISLVINNGQNLYEGGSQLVGSARELLSDPQALLRGFVYLGIERAEQAGKTFLLGLISNGLMEVYLDESYLSFQPMTADEYLRFMGVRDGMDGLDFSESELFSDEEYRMIDIVVEYDIEIFILKLFLKDDATIHVVQRCVTPAWLDGDCVTYDE